MNRQSTKTKEEAPGRPIRLLINGLHSRSGGGATYLRNMLPFIAKDPSLDVHLCIQESQRSLLPAAVEGITLHIPPKGFGFWLIQIWEQLVLPRLARRIGADVTFSTSNYGPLFASNSIILIGNAISVALVERRPMKLVYWGAVYLGTALSLIRSKQVLAVSEYARKSVTAAIPKRLRKPAKVVHHGVGQSFSPPPPGSKREDFLLAVSDVYVQKNLKNLILAIARLRPYHPEISLKIAGGFIDKSYLKTLKEIIEDRNLQDQVEFLGHVALEDLAGLYRRCKIFVFPSLVETFGIPLIEAMASGVPIASSDTAAMPEVLGDAGLYFDPTDVDGIAAAINRLIRDPDLCRELSKKALARAADFTWENAARETLATIKATASTVHESKSARIETS